MGVEPYLVSSALDCVIGQRLARRLCDRCKVAYRPDPSVLTDMGWEAEDVPAELFRAEGCKACAGTGFKGRVAISEVMSVSEEIQRMAVERRPSDEIRNTAIQQGMSSLRSDGLAKVKLGLTSIEEVLRVVV